MVTETRKVFAIAALIMATGIATVEMTRNSAQADPMIVAGGAAGYAGTRVEAAFEIVAAMPAATLLAVAAADKGDLQPVTCNGAAGCTTTAFDLASNEPEIVVEKRGAASSILIRLSRISVAGF